jgi:hypothetical protein
MATAPLESPTRTVVRLEVPSRHALYCLRYAPDDAQTIRIRISGLLRRDGTPWREETRDGWFEITSSDRHLMRGIWKLTRRYVRQSLVLDD